MKKAKEVLNPGKLSELVGLNIIEIKRNNN